MDISNVAKLQARNLLRGGAPRATRYIDMLYADASVLLSQGMKTTKELVDEALAKAGMTPTELGVRLGYKNGYQAYHKLFVSKTLRFAPDKQAEVADILGLPKTHFQAPDLTERRELYIRRTFLEFLKTDVAKGLDAETLRTIERIPFTGEKLPTVALYQSLALAMGGHYSTEQLDSALQLNEEVDRHSEPPRTSNHPAKTRRKSL